MSRPPDAGGRSPFEIRLVRPREADALGALLCSVDAFRPDEVHCALDVVEEFHAGDEDYSPSILWEGERAAGFLCFGKVPLTQSTFDLYWIAVGPDFRRRGYGQKLMGFMLEEVQLAGGRLIVIETSSLPANAEARALYLHCGYKEQARIEGYYGEGDDLMIYTRAVGRTPP